MWRTCEGYKLCSILPTLLMTLLRRFCRSSRRLYQLSDRDVTRPAATHGGRETETEGSERKKQTDRQRGRESNIMKHHHNY